MKWVKGRVVTINNRRREEFNKQEGREEELQGMWSEDQTEVWVPEPVKEVRRFPSLLLPLLSPFGGTAVRGLFR